MAKKSFFLLVMSAAILLVLFSGCTDTPGNTGAGNTSTAGNVSTTEEHTSAITPEITQEINATGTDAVAEVGDTVYVQYVGTYNNGTVFDESEPGKPLVFTLGVNSMITGFEDAVYGMKIGETKTIHLTPDQAYGEYNPDYVINISRDQIPEDTELYEGAELFMQSNTGSVFTVTVLEVTNETVVVDANSKMVGLELNFDITLENIDKAN
jgi:peptidylprolyl isomerase